MSSLETQGKLHRKGDTQQVTETFKKRELVLEIEDGQYTQYVPFELFQDKCSALDPINVGDEIKVHFNLRGREWNGRFFVNLNAWRIERVESGDTQAEKPKEEPNNGSDHTANKGQESDDLPF